MAAGLGFKTFQTGEVLTASDVNGYLMQGILVFATEAARNSAITSPQEGQFAFTKDNNSLWYYTGSAWAASGATGDIEGVTAGVGISGGGTSGTVTITNSMATAIDAKGDLVVGTGADTFARLAVGTNGHTLVADSSTSTGLVWQAPSSTPTFVGCSLTKTANQSTSNVTLTTISWDSENFDTDGFHDNVTNNSRITIPSGKAGKYLFTSIINWNNNATGYREVRFTKNGTAQSYANIAATPTGEAGTVITQILNLAVADYVEIKAEQSSGGALDVKSYSIFQCQYLGA